MGQLDLKKAILKPVVTIPEYEYILVTEDNIDDVIKCLEEDLKKYSDGYSFTKKSERHFDATFDYGNFGEDTVSIFVGQYVIFGKTYMTGDRIEFDFSVYDEESFNKEFDIV